MDKVKIGIVREGKIPPDNRTPLTPKQAYTLIEEYPNIEIFAQWSPVRCYTDDEYEKFEIPVVENLQNCDLLLGIKEVPIEMLIPEKTYMFFSHTIKKQPYNRNLLQAILDKRIRLIDYELLTDQNGKRIIGFGKWAGIVGAHYALLMLGERSGLYSLKAAKNCVNLQEVIDQYETVQFPPARIVITGGGRVANGAIELLKAACIEQISVEDYLLNKPTSEPVFVQLHSADLYKPNDGTPFRAADFYNDPINYSSTFQRFIPFTDILINCMFWDPNAPRLFNEADVKNNDFNISIISDISCDVNGSVPLTHRVTTIEDPVFGYHRINANIGKPYQRDTIDVMAVSNLPNELPKDASKDFGLILKEELIPTYIKNPNADIFNRATIAQNGKLAPLFSYLQDFVDEKE